jgi:cytochrome P450
MIGVLLDEAYERRSNPQNDFISRIVNAEVFDRPMTDDEIGNWMQGAALAGHETTMNASSNLVLDLATDPELQQRVRNDRSLIAHVVEESLRLRPPVQNFFRVTTKDVELHGTTIPAGARVMVIYAAANRDPVQFPEPAKLDPTRAFTKHLTFGWGIHRCAGAYLAQVELRVMADVLLDHPPFEIDGQVDFGHAAGGGTFMGLKALPIRFQTQP